MIQERPVLDMEPWLRSFHKSHPDNVCTLLLSQQLTIKFICLVRTYIGSRANLLPKSSIRAASRWKGFFHRNTSLKHHSIHLKQCYYTSSSTVHVKCLILPFNWQKQVLWKIINQFLMRLLSNKKILMLIKRGLPYSLAPSRRSQKLYKIRSLASSE